MRIMVIAATVAMLLLAAAGCGGSSESADSSTTANESADTTASTDTGGSDTSSDTDTGSTTDTSGDDDDVSLAGCERLTALSVQFSQALGSATSGGGAPDMEATAKAYREFAEQVPEEIRDAFRTVADAFGTYAEVLDDVDLTSGQAPDPDTLQKLAEAAKALDNSELTAASAEIEAWAKKNCNIGG